MLEKQNRSTAFFLGGGGELDLGVGYPTLCMKYCCVCVCVYVCVCVCVCV